MKVSIYWLGQATGKHPATIRKRVLNLPADSKRRYDSILALEAIYCGPGSNGSNGEFVSTPEAVRQLTIAKKEEIDLQMEIQRGERVPIADCRALDNEMLQTIAGTLKANIGKVLNSTLINELFQAMRDWANRFEPK